MRIDSRPLKILWIATQLVAIVACVFIVYASVHSMFIRGNAADQGGDASVGSTIEIHGFNPHKSQYNIVIAMRVNCPYCTSSADSISAYLVLAQESRYLSSQSSRTL